MGPVKSLIALPFAGGVDTKTSEKNTVPTKFRTMVDAVFNKAGAIAKRWGYQALAKATLQTSGTAAGPNLAAGKAINGSYNGELLMYDGADAWGYDKALSAWVKRSQGMVSVVQSNKTIVANGGQQFMGDFGIAPTAAADTQWEVWAYETTLNSQNVVWTIIDPNTGATIVPETPVTGTSPLRPKVVTIFANGAQITYILYTTNNGTGGGGTGEIQVVEISQSGGLFVVATATVMIGCVRDLGGTGSPFYDVAVSGSGANQFVVIYRDSSNNVKLVSSTNLGVQVTVATAITGQTGCLSVVSDAGGNFWATYNDTAGARTSCSTAKYNAALAQTLAPTQVISTSTWVINAIGAVVDGGGLLNVFADTANGLFRVYANTISSAGTLGVAAAYAPVIKRRVGLGSKPFVNAAGQVFVNVINNSLTQSQTVTLAKTATGWPEIARGLYGQGPSMVTGREYMLAEVVKIGTDVFRYSTTVLANATVQNGTVQALPGVNACTLDMASSNHFRSAQLNGGLYTVGGVLQSYDSSQYVEHGFMVYPEFTISGSSSGGFLSTGTYWYVVTYEWIDNNGLRQISNVGTPVSVNFPTGSVNSATLHINALSLTRKGNSVQVHVYRTQANGTILNRVTSYTSPPLYNDTTQDTLTFVDTLADATLATNAACFTQPLITSPAQIIPNDPPPSCSLIASYGDRLWLAGLDNPNQLWFSQKLLQGAPAQFSQLLTFTMDADGGGITAIARMDQALVIFKANAIFLLVGDGPDATGNNNDYQTPTQVPSGGIGCTNPQSIVLTPQGLMFDSGQGIYLLDRSHNVSYKGAPAEDLYNFMGGGGAIATATLIPPQWVVWQGPNTPFGLALVYDYFFDQWANFGNQFSVGSDLWLGPVGGGTHVWVNAAGQVMQQTPGQYLDPGSQSVKYFLQTAWIDPRVGGGQTQGWYRLYHLHLLGSSASASDQLTVSARMDYSQGSFAAYPVLQASGAGTFQVRVDVLYKGQSVQFQFQDTTSNPTNDAGIILEQMTMTVGILKGGMKLPPTQQV